MSDADTNTKSSLNSETDSADNENERLQWMLVEQQKHLLSEYQNKKNSTGGENGKSSLVLPYVFEMWDMLLCFSCDVDR